MRHIASILLAACFLNACQLDQIPSQDQGEQNQDPTRDQGPAQDEVDSPSVTRTVIFDSGHGTGPYDSMTYAKFESLVTFIPEANITVNAFRPDINYCNGSCGYLVFIRDQWFQPLAAQAGMLDAANMPSPTLPDRILDTSVQLSAGVAYFISIEVWTTKSVGIYTTGSRTTGVNGVGTYSVEYAKSDSADQITRGGIAFQLLN